MRAMTFACTLYVLAACGGEEEAPLATPEPVTDIAPEPRPPSTPDVDPVVPDGPARVAGDDVAVEGGCDGCRFQVGCGGAQPFGCYRGEGDACASCPMSCCAAEGGAVPVPPGFEHDPDLGACGPPVASCLMTTSMQANLPVKVHVAPIRTCLEYSLRAGADVDAAERAHMLAEWRAACEAGAHMRAPSVTVRGRTMGIGSRVEGAFTEVACPEERRAGCQNVGNPRTFCATNFGLSDRGAPTRASCERTNGRFLPAP